MGVLEPDEKIKGALGINVLDTNELEMTEADTLNLDTEVEETLSVDVLETLGISVPDGDKKPEGILSGDVFKDEDRLGEDVLGSDEFEVVLKISVLEDGELGRLLGEGVLSAEKMEEPTCVDAIGEVPVLREAD